MRSRFARLEPRAVDLVSGDLSGQSAIGVLDAGSVVDHRVDFARDRHGQNELGDILVSLRFEGGDRASLAATGMQFKGRP